jgi:prepilin-type N-terminal cleavage/methylation domain-containing protein
MGNKNNKAFTLVELSIVLVIIGLIVGGVVGGQSLIKSAQMNKVVTEFQTYKTAVRSFELQYDALPGDFAEAFDYWGTDCASTDVLCNGDGDNSIENNNGATGSGYRQENFQFWKHLSLAEIITGEFTGTQDNDASTPGYASIGVNIPAGAIDGAGFIAQNGGWNDRDATYGKYGNVLIFGKAVEGENYLYGGALTAADAKTLDSKIDDGSPSDGNVRITRSRDIDNYLAFDCIGTGSSNVTSNASYDVSSTFTSCRMAYFLD